MADIAKDNLWHQPNDATVTITGSAEPSLPNVEVMLWGADPADTTTYRSLYGFKNRYVAFQYMVPTEDYDVYLGSGVEKKGAEVMFMNYSVIGDEAVLFFTWDVPVADLFDAIKTNAKKTVVKAASWKVVDVEGKEVVVANDELVNAEFTTDGQTVDLVTSKQTIKNVQSFAPADATAETACKEDEVIRFVVALDAKGVYGAEAKYEMNRAGYYYPRPYEQWSDPKMPGCYAMADLFKKYGVADGTDFVVECYIDGYARDEAWDWISNKYIAYDNRSGHELITLGKVQAKNDDSIWNIGYINSDKAVFAFVPETGLKLADAFARLTIEEPVKYVHITYLDGKTDTLKYETACSLVLDVNSTIVRVELF